MGIRVHPLTRRSCRPWMQKFRHGMRKHRIKIGMMQRELAEKLPGFSVQNVSQIECGQRPGITLELACNIAVALGTTLDRLVGLKDETPDETPAGPADNN